MMHICDRANRREICCKEMAVPNCNGFGSCCVYLLVKLHQRRWVSATCLVLTEVPMRAFTLIQINSTNRAIVPEFVLIKQVNSELTMITYSIICSNLFYLLI